MGAATLLMICSKTRNYLCVQGCSSSSVGSILRKCNYLYNQSCNTVSGIVEKRNYRYIKYCSAVGNIVEDT